MNTAGRSWPDTKSRSPGISVPSELKGSECHGVVATFKLLDWQTNEARLIGYVELRNVTTNDLTFGVDSFFPFHLRIQHKNDKDVPFDVARGFKGLSSRLDYRIGAEQSVRHAFDIDLRQHWKLVPGTYTVGFRYDVRLFRKAKTGENPYIPWSTNAFDLQYTGGSE